jgi:NCAIR mutase (PurE)-related protein
MNPDALKSLLELVQSGQTSVEEAIRQMQHMPFESLEFAHLDHHRAIRRGFPEVIFCQGKSEHQVATIFDRLAAGGGNVLATRATRAQFEAVAAVCPRAVYEEAARCVTLKQQTGAKAPGLIALVTAGTSDIPVIEEARVTCEMMNQPTQTLCDVGVAGIHRLLAKMQILREARVIVVAAGMEGALPSVVAGLVEAPVIAVPTSVGYGANLQGIAPLLTMLNSCASGVAVVNIDNGFAAGYMASVINRLGQPPHP